MWYLLLRVYVGNCMRFTGRNAAMINKVFFIGIGNGIYSTFQHKAVQYNIIYNSDMSVFSLYVTYDWTVSVI